MIETQYVHVDMVPSGTPPVVYMSQYDVGRPVGLVVYASGVTVNLDPYVCIIEATRSDGAAVTVSVSTTGNTGVFSTTATMTNIADRYSAQLVIVDSQERRVASVPLVFVVIPAAMDENAIEIAEDASLYQQYTTAIQAQIAEFRSDLDALGTDVNNESVARAAGDSTLSGYINQEAAARELADTEIGKRFNDLYWLTLTQKCVLAIPSGYGIQGGCYKGGYFYGIYHKQNSQPMLLGKFDLTTGALLDSFQVASTGHGNGVSDFYDNLVLISDSYTNSIIMADVVNKSVRHTISLGTSTSLSSIGASSNYKKIVLQTPGQNALTGYLELPYTQDGYDHVWYQEYLLGDVPAKGTALVQDLTFAGLNFICCLNTNGYANQEKKKNCVRVMCTNGLHIRDCYFDNSIPEPEAISFDSAANALIIVDRTGVVYESESVANIFDSTYVGRTIATLSNKPAVRLSALTNQTETLTDTHGEHSIDMRFPICESAFGGAGVGGDATHRVGDRYAMRNGTDTANVCAGVKSLDGNYITFRTIGNLARYHFRYTIVDYAYAELTRFTGTYVDADGTTKTLTTIGRRDDEDDASFMARIIASASAIYSNPDITNPLIALVRGDNYYRYALAAITLPTA